MMPLWRCTACRATGRGGDHRCGSATRFLVIGGPGGFLNALPAGHPWLAPGEQYADWQVLANIRKPLTRERVAYAQDWALRSHTLNAAV